MDNGKIDRVLSLYSKFMSGALVNKAEEALNYGVNERTIQRDIDDIRNTFENFANKTKDLIVVCGDNEEIRKINYINIEEKDNLIKIEFNGNGFLLNMVRILTGTLVKVGMGEIEPSDVLVILNAKKRAEAGEKAPTKGLCMWCANY